jgi:hypothetical protein
MNVTNTGAIVNDAALVSSVNRNVTSIRGLEKLIQTELQYSINRLYKTGRSEMLEYMLNAYETVGGSFNAQGLFDYLKKHCSVTIRERSAGEQRFYKRVELRFEVKKTENFPKEDKKVEGLGRHADMAQLMNWIKDNPWFIKMKKEVVLEIPKIGADVTNMAKLLALGMMSEQEIETYAQRLLSMVRTARSEKAVVTFVDKWNKQAA